MNSMKVKESPALIIGRWVIRLFLIGWTVTILFPVIWTFYTAFKTNKEFFASVWALPSEWVFDNFVYAWKNAKFSDYFLNSLIVVVVDVSVMLITTSTTAYAVSKFDFRPMKWLNKFYLVVMAIPGVLVLVPQYFMLMQARLDNNLIIVALLQAFAAVPVNVILQVGFMRSVDKALFEAADIDGASEFTKFFNIMLPCVKSVLFLTTLTGVLSAWNNYITPLTYLNDESKYTVSIGLTYLADASERGSEYGAMFAGLVISMIPILIIYAIFQKPLQEGLKTEGGVKG